MEILRHFIYSHCLCALVILFGLAPLCSSSQAQPGIGLSSVAAALSNEPIVIDPSKAYPTVDVLPGSQFQPASSISTSLIQQLARSSNGVVQLPPGDYSIPIRIFCMGVHATNTQHGLAYKIAPLQGKRASILIALMSRAPAAHVPYMPLQQLVWQLEGGLSYDKLPPQSKQLIDQLVPEDRSLLKEDFVETLQKAQRTASIFNSIPGLQRTNAGSQELEAMIQRYGGLRQILLRYANDFDALSQQLVTVLPGAANNAIPTSWSQLGPRAYARMTGGRYYGELGTLQLRVLPSQDHGMISGTGRALMRVNYDLSESSTQASAVENDLADVAIQAIGYPNEMTMQGLSWILQEISPSQSQSGYNLAIKIMPIGGEGAYMIWGSNELSNLQTVLGKQVKEGHSSWLGIGVGKAPVISMSDVSAADLILDLPSSVSDITSSFVELGATGAGLAALNQLSSSGVPSPLQIVANGINMEILAITQTQESLLNNHGCVLNTGTSSNTGTSYKPYYVIGTGQDLVVLVTGLSDDPTSLDLSNLSYGFATIGIGELQYCPGPSSSTLGSGGFVITDYTLSTPIGSSCPSVSAVVVDNNGTLVNNVTVTLNCSPPVKASEVALPTVSGITPSQGPAGTTVSISGTGFVANVTSVMLGGVSAQATVNSSSQITVTIPDNSNCDQEIATLNVPSCMLPVTVTTSAGTSQTPVVFSYSGP
jgi:hypothetical protein